MLIDADSHLTEPPRLWLDRLPNRWHDLAPRVEFDPASGYERWRIGDRWLSPIGQFSTAGWPEPQPSVPRTFNEILPECHDPHARARWLDENGITMQVLYPNVVAFEGHAVLALQDAELQRAIAAAYNDYVSEFCAAEPGRFIALAAVPFWDVDGTVTEIERCAAAGHRGVVWAATMTKHGLPHFTDRHWDPVYDAAQALDMSMNFHVGVGRSDLTDVVFERKRDFDCRSATAGSVPNLLSNAYMITDLLMSDLLDRFPRLKVVSVESGFGYLPYLLEALDWQWVNYDGPSTMPARLMPSDYFRRQAYGMYWFENASLAALGPLAENVMFESDFPHPTCLSSGPTSPTVRDMVARSAAILESKLLERVLYRNAAQLYRVG